MNKNLAGLHEGARLQALTLTTPSPTMGDGLAS